MDPGPSPGSLALNTNPNSSSNCNSDLLAARKADIQAKIEATINYAQELLTIFSEELDITNELILEQAEVSELFSVFCEIWRSPDCNQNNVVGQEINANVHHLSSVLDTLETRAHKASRILRDIMDRLLIQLRELRAINARCGNATNVEELDNVSLPDLSSLETVDYPDLTVLAQEWCDCNIYSRINECIEALELSSF